MRINYNIIKGLSQEQIEQAYRYQRLKNATEDVRYHIHDLESSGEITGVQSLFLKYDAPGIAETYLDKYQDSDLAENDVYRELIRNYLEDAELANYMLVSVFERDISTHIYAGYTAARTAMVEGLQHEFDKTDEVVKLAPDADYGTDDFGIGAFDAWSNLDDDCNCDWKIVRIN